MKRVAGRAGSQRLRGGQVQQLQFGQALGGTHDIGRVDRLVGRNQHEGGHAVALGKFAEQTGAEDIVADGLGRLPLHQVDVLVGGGVEDDFRTVTGEDRLHPRQIEDVRDQREGGAAKAGVVEFLLNQEQGGLGLLDQQQLAGIQRGELPAEFAADAAAGAGDHHHAAGHGLPQRAVIQVDRLTSE
jgi:hypothetical protein